MNEICRPFGKCRRRKCENIQLKNVEDFKITKIFSPLYSDPICSSSCILQPVVSAWLYTATNALLALLAHVAFHNMRAVSDTFTQHIISSHPPRKPNMNENRSHNNMLGPLRSPPPAANLNRASSTALCAVCSYCSDSVSCIACINVESGLLRSRS